MDMDAEQQRLNYALQLIRIGWMAKPQLKFLGTLLIGVPVYAMEFIDESLAEESPLGLTDHSGIYINPKRFPDYMKDRDILGGVIAHEFFHIFYMHCKIKKTIPKANRKYLEKKGIPLEIADLFVSEMVEAAKEHVVNRIVRSLYLTEEDKPIDQLASFIRLPDDCVFFKDIHSEYPNASAETIIDVLLNRNLIKKVTPLTDREYQIELAANNKEEEFSDE